MLFVGFFQRHLVNLYARWRIVAIALGSVEMGLFVVLGAPTTPIPSISLAIYLSVFLGLSCALFIFFCLIPAERAVHRMGPAKLSSIVRLFGRAALSESCGLGILRGTLVGLALLGVNAFLVWFGTTHLKMRLDPFLIVLQGFFFNRWLGSQIVLYPVFQTIIVAYSIGLLTAFLARMLGRPWLAIVLAAALSAAVLPGPFLMMGAVQPYYSKMSLLLLECLILAWTFARFDVLTLVAAVFTFAFWWQNYASLVMLQPTGAFEEWVAFAVWGLLVAAAAAVTFQSAILAAYRRVAMAVQ